MAFVKLDCGILDSTLWIDRESREVFITALLMAEPYETTVPLPQVKVRAIELTGWEVPPGWYGFVHAAGVGIIRRAGVEKEVGMVALEALGEPEIESRSKDFEGRRLVRVDGGFIVLNFMKYRDRDYTTAERSRRYRERLASRRDVTATHRDITQAEEEVELEVEDKKKKGAVAPEPDPSDLDQGAWSRWEAYRKETKKPLKSASIAAAKRELSKFGTEQATVVEHSIANGYQGLFAPKPGKVTRRWE
jgi:hypothetical protein